MIRATWSTLLSAIACLGLAGADAASAHPHVWVTMKSELIFAPDGAMTGVRHNWTFDDMFSVYATQGLKSKQRGRFTREELASLAEVNVSSLKEYRFFTFAKADGKKVQFTEPVDYYLDLRCQADCVDAAFYFTSQDPDQGEATQRRHL
jgi:ABC-type uncharacterized transport system substrate-binding protein